MDLNENSAAQAETQPQTQTQTAESTTQAQQTPPAETGAAAKEKMNAIVGRMAGKEPPKAEPGKPPEAERKPEAKTEGESKKPPPRVEKLFAAAKNSDAKFAALEKKYQELEAKLKEGKASELDKYQMQQIAQQHSDLLEDEAREYGKAAFAELGDGYEAFAESDSYYGQILNRAAPLFVDKLMGMENKFSIINEFYKGFNDGSVDFNKFANLPAPVQIDILRRVDYAIKNPEKAKAAPAAPPKVPVPGDVAISSPPTDRKAKMDAIVSSMAKAM